MTENITPPIAPAPAPKKKKGLSENQKSWLTFVSIAIIGLFGGAYLLLLPTPQEKTATALAEEIKSFEGNGYQQKLTKLFDAKTQEIPDSESAADISFKKDFAASIASLNANFSFSALREFEDGEYGAVEIKDAKLTSDATDESGTKQVSTYSNLIVKKLPDNENKYFFSTDGESKDIESFDGEEQIIFMSKYSGATGEFEVGENGELKSSASNIQKLSFTDGSGTMTYAALEDVYAKFSEASSETETKFDVAFGAKKIDAGDSIKMMLGEIKPLSFNVDFSYVGDPIEKLQKIADANPDLGKYLEVNPATAVAEIGAAEKFSGQMMLTDLTLMSGEMGFVTNFDLSFSGFPYQPIPKGTLNFTIKNYAEIIAYARNFFPLPQEEVDAELLRAKEYFTDNGKDLTFSAIFDGSRIAKLGNGKEIDIVEMGKPAWESPAPAEEIQISDDVAQPVQSDAQPAAVPEVQKRELN